jgi:glycosyltransferase A (GT-A) superfamily protein (DUF2064 family)
VIVYAPADGWPDLRRALSLSESADEIHAPIVMPQRGGDLGDRMANAVHDAASLHDLGPLVLLGADCPLLPRAAIAVAFERLAPRGAEPADVVLGPAEDGGYYLLALRDREPVGPLLANVAWSTERVLAQTAANAEGLGLRLFADLPLSYDIDTPADLLRLRSDLQADPERARDSPAIARLLLENPLPPLSVSGGDGHP